MENLEEYAEFLTNTNVKCNPEGSLELTRLFLLPHKVFKTLKMNSRGLQGVNLESFRPKSE